MKKSKKVIIIVSILIILFLLVIISIVLLNKNNIASQITNDINTNNTDIAESIDNTAEEEGEEIGDEEETEEIEYNKLSEVTNSLAFFTVQDCIEKYLNIENSDNSLYVIKMLEYHTEKDTTIKYVARAMRLDSNNKITYANFIVYMNYLDMIYEVESIDNITNIDTVDFNNYKGKPDSNKHFSYKNLEDTEIINQYLQFWVMLLNTNFDMALGYLSDDYKSQVSENEQSFKEYIEKNKNILEKIEIEYVQDSDEEEYTNYLCVDTNGYYYSINETAIMQFKVNAYGLYSE